MLQFPPLSEDLPAVINKSIHDSSIIIIAVGIYRMTNEYSAFRKMNQENMHSHKINKKTHTNGVHRQSI